MNRSPSSSYLRTFLAFGGALTAVRILAIIFGYPELGPDEGQYWFWSQSPAFGYFSKPPLIAWSIAGTTALFGESEGAVRLSAPFYQFGAATFLFALTQRLAGPREALIAGAAWLTLPGVFLSSALITTDSPLTFFWSAALYYFFRVTDSAEHCRRPHAALLGAAIGFGFLSKYAMSYFLLSAAIVLAFSPLRRRAAGISNIVIAGAVAIAVFAPNIWWNAENNFQTLSHTAANANWSRSFGHPEQVIKFFGDQVAIVGPIMLGLIIMAGIRGRRSEGAGGRDHILALLAFSIPAITIVTAQAFISRAHGNWAAVAYPSAVALAAIYACRSRTALIAIKSSILLHLIIGVGFLAAFVSAPFADRIGADTAFKKLRGWKEISAKIATKAAPFDAIMTDDREITGELVYYARGQKRIVAWNSNVRIDSHFEAFYSFDSSREQRVLYVSSIPEPLYVQGRFASIKTIGPVTVEIGQLKTRTLYLFDASGFVGS